MKKNEKGSSPKGSTKVKYSQDANNPFAVRLRPELRYMLELWCQESGVHKNAVINALVAQMFLDGRMTELIAEVKVPVQMDLEEVIELVKADKK